MEPRDAIPLLDAILDAHRDALAGAHEAYRNHCLRVFHFAKALGAAEADEEALTIALAFHDLGIWTDGTFDYLAPSAERARRFVAERGPRTGEFEARVVAIIENHHKLRAHASDPLVEVFRRADFVDVTLGMRAFGLRRSLVRRVQRAFPNAGFHVRLLKLTARQALLDPLRPLPMLRW